jgi:hypothetical protein
MNIFPRTSNCTNNKSFFVAAVISPEKTNGKFWLAFAISF